MTNLEDSSVRKMPHVTTTQDVVIHQFRQMILYTFYFSGIQLIFFHYNLRANWTFLVFVILLCISVYEDTMFFDQDHIPEPIVVLRIWANNVPLIAANTLIYILERGNVLTAEPAPGPKVIGRPQQMTIHVPPTGLEIVDDILLAAAYYLWYFSSFAMFRSVVAQLRLVSRLMRENLNWSSDNNESIAQNEDDAINIAQDVGNENARVH